MTDVEIISLSISMKIQDKGGLQLATPGSSVGTRYELHYGAQYIDGPKIRNSYVQTTNKVLEVSEFNYLACQFSTYLNILEQFHHIFLKALDVLVLS